MSYYRVELKKLDSDEWDSIPQLEHVSNIALGDVRSEPKLSEEEATKQMNRLANSFPYEFRIVEVND